MRIKTIIPSQAYPVSLAEAKKQLGFYHSEDDAWVQLLIETATTEAEDYTGITCMFSTVQQAFDAFPSANFELQGIPAVKVLSIQYYDDDDELQTLATSAYRVDTYSTYARVQVVASWPSTYNKINAVLIKYVVGYAAQATADATTDAITLEAHPFTDNDQVMVYAALDGAVPTGLTANKIYYVVNSTSTTLKLSATSGGTAIDITANGSTWYLAVQPVPKQLTAAIKLVLTHLNENRQDVVTGTIVNKVPMTSRHFLNLIKPKRI